MDRRVFQIVKTPPNEAASTMSSFFCSLFDLLLRQALGLHDFPLAGIVELEREKKIGAEPVRHFAGVVSSRDDLLVGGVEQSRVRVDPSVHFRVRPNEAQVQSLFL